MRKYIITTLSNYIIAIVFEEDKPVLIHAYDKEEEALLGNVYVGRVRDLVKNINSAFVEIGPDKVCYYSLNDNTRHIFLNRKNTDKVCQGDLLLVQVSKEAMKTKAPSVSSDISFTGNYIVLALDGKGEVGISSKIKDTEYKNRLRSLLTPLVSEGEGRFSLVVRTAAYGADFDEVIREAAKWCAMAKELLLKSVCRPAFTCLYRKEPEYISDLREEKLAGGDRIVTDLPEICEEIRERLLVEDSLRTGKADREGGRKLPTLELYTDSLLPLYKLYSFEKHIKEALQPRVWLKSGAYLVIEPTEALTVIDVNTGKFDGNKKDREETFFKINLEAAAEIGRQLRLRNISGIIVVDFVNLEKEEHQKMLIRQVRQITEKDRVPTFYIEMTKLGLIELTRKKIKRNLREILKNIYL